MRPAAAQAAHRPDAVRLHEFSVSWHGRAAVHRVSGAFAAGRATAIVGPNGAGKSTLLAALAGVPLQTDGRIERDAAQRVAWLPQSGGPDRDVPLEVGEFVAMGAWSRLGCLRGVDEALRQEVGRALRQVGLEAQDRRLLPELSAGQRQRALFARLLLQDADIVLLDEPFNAVDAATTEALLRVVGRWREQGRTVIAVLHDLAVVRAHFDEALLLAREPVAWGPTGQALQPAALQRARHLARHWEAPAAEPAPPLFPRWSWMR
jgi:zinc/manganese transport system ATP-binding protein